MPESRQDKYIEIPVGDRVITAQHWAKEVTLEKLLETNQASRKAIEKVLMQLYGIGKTETKSARQTKSSDSENIRKSNEQNAKMFAKVSANQNTAFKKAIKRVDTIPGKIENIFSSSSLKDFATATGKLLGVGAVAGFAVGTLQQFADSTAKMSHVGVGLASTFIEMKQRSANLGITLGNYSSLVVEHGEALRYLGKTTDDGATELARLSQQVRKNVQEFGNYGLTNKELNEIILNEIEVRRKGGLSLQHTQNNLATSMTLLLTEATALAQVTGQNKLDIIKQRQETLSNPAIQGALLQGRLSETQQQNISSVVSLFGAGGEIGKSIGNVIAASSVTNFPLEAYNSGELTKLIGSFPEIGKYIRELQAYVKSNSNLKTEEFKIGFIEILGNIKESIKNNKALAERATALSYLGKPEAQQAISLVAGLQGLETNSNVVKNIFANAPVQLKESTLIGISAKTEEFGRQLEATGLTAVISGFGLDVKNAGNEVTDALHSVTMSLRTFSRDIENKGLAGATLGAALENPGVSASLLAASGGVGTLVAGGFAGGVASSYLGGKLFGKKGVAKAGTAGLAKAGGAGLFRTLPVIGSLISAGLSVKELLEGDYIGAGIQGTAALASLIPGYGTVGALGLQGLYLAHEYSRAQSNTPKSNAVGLGNIHPLMQNRINKNNLINNSGQEYNEIGKMQEFQGKNTIAQSNTPKSNAVGLGNIHPLMQNRINKNNLINNSGQEYNEIGKMQEFQGKNTMIQNLHSQNDNYMEQIVMLLRQSNLLSQRTNSLITGMDGG